MLIGVLVCAVAAMLRDTRLTNDRARRREAAARERLEAILDALPHGVIAADTQGRVTTSMRQRPELTGCSSDAALQEPVRDVVRLFDRDERLVPTTALDRALAGVSAQSDQHWLQRRGDSAPVPIAEIARPLVDAHGNIDGAVLVLRDALAQRAAAETSRLQLAVVDASPDAIVGIDAQGRIVSWNGAAQRIFGYDEAHAHGRALDTLVAQRWLRRYPLTVSFETLRRPIGPLEVLCVRRDGRRFRASVSACPVRGDARNCVALSLTLRETRVQRRRDLRTQRSLQGARTARAGRYVEPPEGRAARHRVARAAHAAERDLRLGRGAAQRRRRRCSSRRSTRSIAARIRSRAWWATSSTRRRSRPASCGSTRCRSTSCGCSPTRRARSRPPRRRPASHSSSIARRARAWCRATRSACARCCRTSCRTR
jgi:PAS domain S-box-containing protein